MKKIWLTFLLTGLLVGLSYAQSPWLSDTRMSSVSVEWDKPLFNKDYIDSDVVTGASSVLFLTGRARINENFRAVVELPISHFGYESSVPGDDNSTVLGNVYLGGIYDIRTNNPDNHAFVELGVRLPTTPESKFDEKFGAITGMASESYDRIEAFMVDSWGIPLIGSFITRIDGPFAVRARLGTVYNIYTDDLKDLENCMSVLYGVTALYREPKVEAHLGFAGRNEYINLPSGVDFFDTGFTQLRAGIARPFQNITVGVHARLPLGDNFTEIVDFAYGFNVEIRR